MNKVKAIASGCLHQGSREDEALAITRPYERRTGSEGDQHRRRRSRPRELPAVVRIKEDQGLREAEDLAIARPCVATPTKTPRKLMRIVTRSASGGSFLLKRDPPVTPVVPRTFVSLRDEMVLRDRITQFMEDNDEIYRGETACPASYSPLTPQREEDIIAQLPEDTGLTVISGPPHAFIDLFSPSVSRMLSGTPQRTYAGRRSFREGSVSSESGDTERASSTEANASDTEEGNSASQATDLISPRRSARLGIPSDPFVVSLRELRLTYDLRMAYTDLILPTPFVDSLDVLSSVLLKGPSRQATQWRLGCKELGGILAFLGSSMDGFTDRRVRWGVGFEATGIITASAVQMPIPPAVVQYIGRETTGGPMLKWIANYQKSALEQFFPIVSSTMTLRGEMLASHGLVTPFPHSPFSTFELRDLRKRPMAAPEKQWEVRFCDMMVVTVVGEWDWEREGHLMLHAEGRMVRIKCGDTFVFPAGVQSYSFVPIASKNATQFLVCQFFHSSVARWLEKGGKADHELDLEARDRRNKSSVERLHQWARARKARGVQSRKFFQKLSEVASVA
ncbi:hypothetical protein C8F01DRAFT_1091765 [Mycena amicta]|nr:hypothetical protein C8F01DRAFT_1091765 [Mycena amicta]